MTQEDLEQIRAIVSSAISANNEVLFAAMRAIEEHVDRNIADLRDEFGKRLDLVERHLDRLDSRFSVFEFQMAGIGKSSLRARSSTAN
jgi:septation ring formation regulator EzrA